MKKNIKYKLIGFAILVATVAACNMENQDVSPIVAPSNSYPTFTSLELDNDLPIIEGDTIYFTLTTSIPIDQSITVTPIVDTSSSTLVEGEDFDIFSATIEPWSTEAKIMIVTYSDIDPEESGSIAFGTTVKGIAQKYLLNPNTEFLSATVSIDNYLSDDLNMEFAWETDVYLDLYGGPYSACDNMDVDVIVCTDWDDPWGTYLSIWDAATGNCPETWTISGWEDGEYYFFSDLYDNGFYGAGGPIVDIPITSTFTRAGSFSQVLVQDAAEAFKIDTEPGSFNGKIAKVTIANGTYTVTAPDGTDIVSGKTNAKTKRPLNLPKH